MGDPGKRLGGKVKIEELIGSADVVNIPKIPISVGAAFLMTMVITTSDFGKTTMRRYCTRTDDLHLCNTLANAVEKKKPGVVFQAEIITDPVVLCNQRKYQVGVGVLAPKIKTGTPEDKR